MSGAPTVFDADLMRTARGFDRLSTCYDVLASLFPRGGIRRSQLVHVDRLVECRRVLIVGGGTGGFLVALLRSGFAGRIVNLDLSEGMLRRSIRAVGRQAPEMASRVEHRVGTVDALNSSERFDLVCTNFFLDLFEPTEMMRVMQRLKAVMEPHGTWLCTDFVQPSGPGARSRVKAALIRGLYAFFGVVCKIRPRRLPPIEAGFRAFGLTLVRDRSLACGLLRSAVYQGDVDDAPRMLDDTHCDRRSM
jgi:ubiquinone/menaquinone biosynthesis C-methylase UbiE